MEEIERARRYGTGLSVIMADIDHFKRLNDEFGHLLGDEVLRRMSALFTQHLRKSDIVCRYGGDEFAVLLPEMNSEVAVAVAEKLRKLAHLCEFSGVPRPVKPHTSFVRGPQAQHPCPINLHVPESSPPGCCS